MKIFFSFCIGIHEKFDREKCIFVIHKLYFVGFLSDNDDNNDICQLIFTGLFKQAGW